MKQIFAVLRLRIIGAGILAAAVLAGCNGSAGAPSVTPTGAAPVANATPPTAPKPATPVVDSPKTDSNAHKVSDPITPQVNIDPRTGMDPSRINQLKDLKIAIVRANGHKIKAWLMDNESKRQEGMMFLEDKDVRNDEGMLFVFSEIQPNDANHGFWMHNCPLGLDICYIGPNKKVLNIADGKPFNDTSLPAAGNYLYVLEMKKNCAKNLGIKPGTSIEIPNGLKAEPDRPQ